MTATSTRSAPQSAFAGLYDLLADLTKNRGSKDFYRRPLVCTPCGGCYCEVAWWVICVDGSPPRATLIVPAAAGYGYGRGWSVACLDGSARGRRLGAKQILVVMAFMEEFLSERYIDRARMVRINYPIERS
jgi:hypothetical protein